MHSQFTFILLAGILLTSCQSGFADLSHNLPVQEISKISVGKYTGIAWVSETILALEVDEGNRFEGQRACSQQKINIYEIKTKQSQFLPLPIEGDCQAYIIRNLQALPNQQAGYIFEYPKLNSRIIKSIDVRTGVEIDLHNESHGNTSLYRFSYSPDMKKLLSVDAPSILMRSAIYLLDNDETKTNITTDFLRADFPAWSQNRNLIAFLGTKPYPGSDDEIEHFSETERRLDYPWRLYLYNPESLSSEELPIDIVGPSSLKWSPDGKIIAFSGEYKGIAGVWVVDNFADPDKLTITRIVDGLATFDFSPDGKSIAFAYIGLQNTQRQNILYIVDLGTRR